VDSSRFAALVAAGLEAGEATDKEALHRLKRRAQREAGLPTLPPDREVAALLPPQVARRFQDLLRTKPTRSRSGVAVVAVMSSPAACPHGKCSFCPGGPEVDAPQSYTGFEPSTMRARRHGYDAYAIVRERLAQLAGNGHAIDKVEVVVQGGTFPAREPAYQDWFVAGIYAGLNDGPGTGAWETEAAWAALPPAERDARLAALQRANEAARCRAVGLTIETKPDWCLEPHLDAMLRHGATRVEVGVQALDDGVLRATHRGHTLDDTRHALRAARDAGFKVCAHLMPGLPRERPGSELLHPDPAADVEDFRRLFAEPDWRPDMLKVYPTLVVAEGETLLKRQWREGRYEPYGTQQAARVVADGKGFVPAWCRIQRIDRDIPTTHVEAGVMNSNLRQLARQDREARGLPPCRCLRCREPAERAREGRPLDPARLELRRTDYEAGGGLEAFLSFEDAAVDGVAGFVRLRRPGAPHRPEAQHPRGVAFVRELKVHGTALALGEGADAEAFQHRGLGRRLLAEAERVAFAEWGVGRLLVIAGPGVKPYYRGLGYGDVGAYVGKERAP
jgi:elongator complex protein 3